MRSVPFDQFLEDLALYGSQPDQDEAAEDLAGLWAALPATTRDAVLDDLGVPASERAHTWPRLEGTQVLFEEGPAITPARHEPVDPAVAAAEAMAQAPPMESEMEDEDALLEDAAAAELVPTELTPEEAELDDADLDGPEVGAEPHEAELEATELEHLDELDEMEHLDEDLIEAELDEDELAVAGEFDEDELDEMDALEEGEADEEQAEQEDTPALPENTKEIEVYPVYEPYGYVRILYDMDHHQYLYQVVEPELDPREAKILDFIEQTIVDVLDVGLEELTHEDAETMLHGLTDSVIADYSIEVDATTLEKLKYYTTRDFLGFGKLDIIMRDGMIEDISCDGTDIPIFLYHRKYESMASTIVFPEDAELDSFVIKLAQRSGKHISIADPLLDARLPDGSRLNATLSREVTAAGSTFTVRKFKPEPFTPPDLIRFGTQSPEMQAYLWMAIQHGASLILAGGTASGKTTALNAMLLFIPPQMKIVSIEDTRELNLPHPNWIPGTTRTGFGPRNSQGTQAGEIDMFQLLKAALRQRPEYIAVGEVRGEEATVLFQAMATGHAAYGTMHADSVQSVIHRLEGKPISIPRPLLEALDVVCIQIQTRIGGKRVRRTKEIVEVVGLDPNTKELLTNEVFRWDPATDEFHPSGVSYVLERVQRENNLSRRELQEEMANRTILIEWLVEAGVRDYQRVAKMVQAYYNEPEDTVAKVRAELIELREKAGESGEDPYTPDEGPVAVDDDADEIDGFPDLPEPEPSSVSGIPLDVSDDEAMDLTGGLRSASPDEIHEASIGDLPESEIRESEDDIEE